MAVWSDEGPETLSKYVAPIPDTVVAKQIQHSDWCTSSSSLAGLVGTVDILEPVPLIMTTQP